MLYVLAACSMQTKILFPAQYAGSPDPSAVPANAVELTRDVDDITVTAWLVPAPDATPAQPAPVVQFFHGNAELIDHQADIIRGYHALGVSVLLVEYRGYGRSGGAPSQAALTDDAVWFFDQVVKREDVDASRVYLHGRSVGGGVAGQVLKVLLERDTPPAGVVLNSPFTSVSAIAWAHGVPPFLVRHPFRTDRVLPEYAGPVLIFHGTNDTVIPASHGRRLAELAPNARLVEYADTGHNDLPPPEESAAYWQQIAEVIGADEQAE